MTQRRYNRLLVSVFDEVDHIQWCQNYLEIALDQLDNPTSDTVTRLKILLISYLEQVKPCFDNLDSLSCQRQEMSVNS